MLKRFSRFFCVIAMLLQYNVAMADAPLIWNGIDAALLNNFPGGLKGKDGTIYPRNYLGPKNYAALGSSRTTGWAVAGAATLSQVYTPAVVIPEPLVGSAIAIGTGSTTTDYAYYTWKIDPSDSTVQQKLTWAQFPNSYTSGNMKLDIYSCTVAWTANTCSGTATRIPLTTDSGGVTSIPATQNFATNYAAPAYATAPFMQMRIVTVASGGSLRISSVYTGPGQTVQGGYVGPDVAFTPVFNAAWGTGPACQELVYRVIGSGIMVRGACAPGTSPTGSALTLAFPNSWTSSNATQISAGSAASTLGSNVTQAVIIPVGPSSTFGFSSSANWSSASFTGTAAAGGYVQFEFFAPITQLAGSGTVNLAQNDCEYLYNSNTANGGDTTSFAYGPGGGVVPNITQALTANVQSYRVRAASPIQSTDRITYEYQLNGTGQWLSLAEGGANIQSFNFNGGNYVGVYLNTVNSTDIDIKYGVAGGSNAGGYASGATGSYATWNGYFTSGTRNRVKKCAGATVSGFAAYVPGQSAGLVPAVGLPGSTSGTAACSGCVGQVVESIVSTSTSFGASSAYQDCTSITLPAGNWTVDNLAAAQLGSATTFTRFISGIGLASGNSNPISQVYTADGTGANATYNVSGAVPGYKVSLAASTTIYSKVFAAYTGSAPTFQCRITAQRTP